MHRVARHYTNWQPPTLADLMKFRGSGRGRGPLRQLALRALSVWVKFEFSQGGLAPGGATPAAFFLRRFYRVDFWRVNLYATALCGVDVLVTKTFSFSALARDAAHNITRGDFARVETEYVHGARPEFSALREEQRGARARGRNACIAQWLIRQPIMRLGVSRHGRIADSSAETSVITSSLK